MLVFVRVRKPLRLRFSWNPSPIQLYHFDDILSRKKLGIVKTPVYDENKSFLQRIYQHQTPMTY